VSERVNRLRENLLHALSDTMSAGMNPNELVLVLEQFIDAKIEEVHDRRQKEIR
jgi:hypothetical protein